MTRRSSGRLTPVTPWPAAGSLDEHVRAEQVRVVYQQAVPAQLLSIVAAGIVCAVLWNVAERARLLAWLAVITAITLLRIGLALRFRRSAPGPDAMPPWEVGFIASLAAVSLAWGLGGWLVMPRHSVVHQAIVYFYLMGVAGAAVASYAAHSLAAAVAIVALMVPATVAFGLQPVPELRALALGGLLYLGAALRSIRTFSFFLRRTFQLSFELHTAWDKARDLALTDDLTGLANRRAFTHQARAALDQARRYRRPLAVIMFDIDHFKKINDTYGHAAGDAALVAVAGVLRQAARAADLPGRLGGEEFGVLLPETTEADAMVLAERLRADLAALVIPHAGVTLRFTCSFGVAEVGAESEALDRLLNAADAALYRAKALGRNRVERAGNPGHRVGEEDRRSADDDRHPVAED